MGSVSEFTSKLKELRVSPSYGFLQRVAVVIQEYLSYLEFYSRVKLQVAEVLLNHYCNSLKEAVAWRDSKLFELRGEFANTSHKQDTA